MQQQRFDITDRRDVACLVNVFYDRVRDDDLLGPIFDDVAHVDWATHLPRMYDFWESVLFSTATFKGTPLVVHRALARHAPLTAEAFDRWVALFRRPSTISSAGRWQTMPRKVQRESPRPWSTASPLRRAWSRGDGDEHVCRASHADWKGSRSRRLRLRAGYPWELLIDVMKESAQRSVGAWLIEREQQVQVA